MQFNLHVYVIRMHIRCRYAELHDTWYIYHVSSAGTYPDKSEARQPDLSNYCGEYGGGVRRDLSLLGCVPQEITKLPQPDRENYEDGSKGRSSAGDSGTARRLRRC